MHKSKSTPLKVFYNWKKNISEEKFLYHCTFENLIWNRFLKKGCYKYTQRIWLFLSSVLSTSLSWAELFTKHFCFDVSRHFWIWSKIEIWHLTYSTFPLNTSATFLNEITEKQQFFVYMRPLYTKKIVKNVRIQSKPAANAYDVPTKSWATTGSFTIFVKI